MHIFPIYTPNFKKNEIILKGEYFQDLLLIYNSIITNECSKVSTYQHNAFVQKLSTKWGDSIPCKTIKTTLSWYQRLL